MHVIITQHELEITNMSSYLLRNRFDCTREMKVSVLIKFVTDERPCFSLLVCKGNYFVAFQTVEVMTAHLTLVNPVAFRGLLKHREVNNAVAKRPQSTWPFC